MVLDSQTRPLNALISLFVFSGLNVKINRLGSTLQDDDVNIMGYA